MGCDEVVESVFIGPLSVGIQAPQTNLFVNHPLAVTGLITGRAARLEWSFGDGPTITNASYITSHAWSSSGDYTITFRAYNADQPAGVSATQVVHVSLPSQPLLQVPVMTTNGFQFQFAGQAGVTYILELATNLMPPIWWQPTQTNTGIDGTVQVTGPVGSDAGRFYRIRAQ